MFKKSLKSAIIILLLPIIGISFYFERKKDNAREVDASKHVLGNFQTGEEIKNDRIERVEIVEDSTYGGLMETASVTPAISMEIYNASKDVYDLVKIRLGRFLELVYNGDTDELKDLYYKIDSEEQLHVSRSVRSADTATGTGDVVWIAEREDIAYEVKTVVSEGVVESSMYQAALDNDIDERAIIELANAFQWTLDFAMDPRVGDTFSFVWEERYLEGEYKMPGRILAGKYVNAGKEHYVYYFEESEENIGYFDEDGNSVQKMFLRAPVSFKYISSGFTTGRRYIEAFNVSTGHKAIDYAAAYGTPIRSVGDGTVTFAGWSGGYGNMISIRHNGTYSTNYAHQSRFAVRRGERVKQGEVIGYVWFHRIFNRPASSL